MKIEGKTTQTNNKTISYNSLPQKSVKWNQLNANFTRLDGLMFASIEWSEISEIHVIGSKKKDSEIEITEDKWGEYISNGCLICIYDYRTEYIPWINKLPYKLDVLDIRFLDIREIDLSIILNVRKLVLSDNPSLKNISGYEHFSWMTDLNLNFTSIERIPCLNNFSRLGSINLRKTLVSNLDIHGEMTRLKYMDISGTLIKDVRFLEKCPNLQLLSMSNLDVIDLSAIGNLLKLETLNCSKTKINNVPPVGCLLHLRTLIISYTDIYSLEGAEFPESLRALILDGTKIDTIPESISLLRELRRLMLNELHLKTLPKSILKLCLDFNFSNKGFGIGLFNTIIDDMDVSIFQQPRDIIESWFENRDMQGKLKGETLNEAKVVFLGDGGAGKSLSIQRLLNDCEEQPDFDGEATPGISIQDKYYYIKGKKILIHYWDFGGQEIMHSMHRMFLTQRTLYVVLLASGEKGHSGSGKKGHSLVG